jgi:hypothetical protein
LTGSGLTAVVCLDRALLIAGEVDTLSERVLPGAPLQIQPLIDLDWFDHWLEPSLNVYSRKSSTFARLRDVNFSSSVVNYSNWEAR